MRLWILVVPRALVLATIVLSALAGAQSQNLTRVDTPEEESAMGADSAPPGNWRKILPQNRANPAEGLSEEEIEALDAIGYLGGYEEGPEKIGVTIYDPKGAYNGYNLYIAGHAYEASLVDMNGQVVHTWQYDISSHYNVPPERRYWRRVQLLPDGGLLALCERAIPGGGIIRLDKDSNLLWSSELEYGLHHDLFVTGDGTIYALGKSFKKIPSLHETLSIIDDIVIVLDSEGHLLDRYSILEAFKKSPFAEDMLGKIAAFFHKIDTTSGVSEAFHTNTIEVLDGTLAHRSPYLKKNNILGCSPTHHNAWIIDGETHEVVWNWFGPWRNIHEFTMLDSGNFLMFHNYGYNGPNGQVSQAIEYDFLSKEEVWKYQGDPERPESEFRSWTSSTVERLPNGNTLIVVSESGRAIEVTPGGDVVWEFFNPHRAGDEKQFIATLFQLLRVGPEYDLNWLNDPSAAPK